MKLRKNPMLPDIARESAKICLLMVAGIFGFAQKGVCMNPHARRHRSTASASRGVTLIELIIVVAIVAILTAIALPSYYAYILKTNRAAATGCLSQYSNYMERYYTTNLRYDQDTTGVANTLPALDCATTQNTGKNYSYAFASGSLTQSTYTLQATPIGTQTQDTQCGTLSLTQSGVQGITGAGSTGACW